MINRIVDFSLNNRFLVIVAWLLVALVGRRLVVVFLRRGLRFCGRASQHQCRCARGPRYQSDNLHEFTEPSTATDCQRQVPSAGLNVTDCSPRYRRRRVDLP